MKENKLDILRVKWIRLSLKLTDEEIGEIGKIYLKEIIGLNDSSMKRFLKGDNNIYNRVGKVHKKLHMLNIDTENFWNGINEIIPNFHSEDEIDFLVDGGTFAVLAFLFHMYSPPG